MMCLARDDRASVSEIIKLVALEASPEPGC